MTRRIFYTFLPLLALLCSCRAKPVVDYISIQSEGYEAERAFLEAALDGNLEPLGLAFAGEVAPDIFIDFYSSWEFEVQFKDQFEDKRDDILISKTWLVPRIDLLSDSLIDPPKGRQDTSLAACLEGKETLIPLEELSPPYTALTVDGLDAGSAGYPLVRAAGIRVRYAEQTSPEWLKKEPGVREAARIRARLEEKTKNLEASLRSLPMRLIEEKPHITWIASGGDLMLDRGAQDILFEEGPEAVFGETAEFLLSAELALVNLEGPVSSRGQKVTKSFNFRFAPRAAAALKDAGIDAVLQANNHAFDYGSGAFLDSLSHLAEAGIGVLGAGLNDAEAARPWVYTANGLTCRVFGLASFPRERNGWDGLTAAAAPDKAGMLHAGKGGRELLKTHFVKDDGGDSETGEGSPESPEPSLDIVLFHGGIEWSTRPDEPTRELYTDLIRAGADLVIGSHPHIVQGFEWIEGKPVFWSLGNYVFGGMENTDGGEEGLFIRLGYWGSRLVYIRPYALQLSHTRTKTAPDEMLATFYRRSRSLSGAGAELRYTGIYR
jgi:poly-gamma-glutamate synthesis protein (capsule biosynthesis protein)